jgi:hypothetical protein
VADRGLALPPGCEITYELEALDMLRRLLRPAARGDAFEAWYLDFKERFGGRPTALDMFHAGFNPRASGHGRWFDFVRDQGALTDALAAMRREGALPGQVGIDALTARFVALAARHPPIGSVSRRRWMPRRVRWKTAACVAAARPLHPFGVPLPREDVWTGLKVCTVRRHGGRV